MCSAALPDMELPAVYSSLTSAGSKCVILTAAQGGGRGGQGREGGWRGGLLQFHRVFLPPSTIPTVFRCIEVEGEEQVRGHKWWQHTGCLPASPSSLHQH